jgi:hypothetical protein
MMLSTRRSCQPGFVITRFYEYRRTEPMATRSAWPIGYLDRLVTSRRSSSPARVQAPFETLEMTVKAH